ncbi:glycosyltransferase family 4 protein [Pseudarthrobacter sp. N5]|uniref:glycosyltransferase family 4 protein n=1 Tax=Pseudarthrobacter sp. N5 TaxID=3418416 RepID=UPI003CF103D8
MSERPLKIRLLVPANIGHNSGGTVYNTMLARELAALGAVVELLPVDGSWPIGTAKERRRLGRLLGEWGTGAVVTTDTPEAVTIVDGLIACGAPDELEYAAAAGRRNWVLLHMPVDGHPDCEGRALRAAAGVICTSTSAAAEISERHNIHGVKTALPGTTPAETAAGSDPPRLIVVAALLPNKDQLLAVGALAQLKTLPWTASLVGSDSADPGYARLVRDAMGHYGLQDRVRITGQLTGEALEEEWGAADLSLLVSRAETFGLVVTESIARGIPAVVRKGTGAEEALAYGSKAPSGAQPALPGAAVELDADPAPLAEVLREWLTQAELRAGWREAALAARGQLPGWDSTARAVREALRRGEI